MTKNLIIDISHHQPSNRIDWAHAAKEVALMIIRVQYGSLTIDREYKKHVANCKKYGIPYAHYAYARFVNVNDAKVEAKDFLDRIDKEAKFLVLDVEELTTPKNQIVDASQTFIDSCKGAGWKTGLYTGHHFYKPNGMDKVKADFLWIPRYGDNRGTPDAKPDYPCDLWQYTDKGRVSWYGGNLDLNQLNSSKNLEWFIGNQKDATKKEESEIIVEKKETNDSYIHIIKVGDTLSGIAIKYGVTVDYLVKLNEITNPDRIFPGQRLKFKGKVPQPTVTAKYHKVANNDTVSKLAAKYGSTIKQIKDWNKLDHEYTIYVGKTIRVK